MQSTVSYLVLVNTNTLIVTIMYLTLMENYDYMYIFFYSV